MSNPYATESIDTSFQTRRELVQNFISAAKVLEERRDNPYDPHNLPGGFGDQWAIPHSETFAGTFNWYQRYYSNYFDEALINSQENALAMRRDGFVHELLRHRQLPTVALSHAFECDDPDDPDQVKVKKEVARVVEAIDYFQQLKLQLTESYFYGKSGVQLLWGKKRISGRTYITVSKHLPVHGDKIVYNYDGTPGILIFAGSTDIFADKRAQRNILNIDKGPALFLNEDYYRDSFIIHEFERSDTDYQFESQKALAAHGLGFRDRYYWMWNMRAELIGWMFNALQRVGANGMLYAFYQTGNPEARDATLAALRNLTQENIAAFPMALGAATSSIEHIETTGVGYEVLYNLIVHFEEIMRRGFLGQNLSSQSAATGLGSGVADLQAGTFENIILYDSTCLAETLDQQLVSKIIKFNTWTYKGVKYRGEDLPFNVRMKLQVNRQNVKDMIAAAQVLAQMGVPLDMENLRDIAGLAAPRNNANMLVMPGGSNGQTDNRGAVQSENNQKPDPDDSQDQGFHDRNGKEVDNKFNEMPHEIEKFERDHFTDPSILVSLSIPDYIAQALKIPNGESPEEMHVTIAYLGKLSFVGQENTDKAREVVKMLAENSLSMNGHIGGMGRFSATPHSDSKDVVYAGVNIPALTSLREELCHVFKLAGIPYKENHGYTPHVTLKYISPEARLPVKRIENMPVTFSHIRFSVGKKIEDFYLRNSDDNDHASMLQLPAVASQ